jgi:hypothetical protein
MIKGLLVIIFLFLSRTALYSQSLNYLWSQPDPSILNPPADFYNDVIPCSNGDVVSVGWQSSSSYDALITKFSKDGQLLWSNKIQGVGNDFFQTAMITNDGNILCFGTTSSNDLNGFRGGNDILITKFDQQGNIIWTKCHGGSLNEGFFDVVKTYDGNAIMVGTTTSNDWGINNFNTIPLRATTITVKFDSNGEFLWGNSYGIACNGSDIVEKNDGNLAIGFTIDYSTNSNFIVNNNRNFFLSTLDKNNGNIVSSALMTGIGCNQINLIQSNGSVYSLVSCTAPNSQLNLGNYYNVLQKDMDTFVSPRHAGGYQTITNRGVVLINDSILISLTDLSPNGAIRIHKLGFNDTYMTLPFVNVFHQSIRYNPFSKELFISWKTGRNSTIWKGKFFENSIKGRVYIDKNSNGQKETNEPFFNSASVISTKNGSTISSFTDTNGAFSNVVDTGTYTTTLSYNRPYYISTPTSKTSIIFPSSKDSFDFALQPIPNKRDLVVSLIAQGPARPGFDVSYKIDYKNVGTETLSGTIKLVKANKLTLLNAQPSQATFVADTITWNYSNLPADSGSSIILNLKVIAPPAINNGDTLKSSVTINPFIGDETTIDNASSLNQIVTGAYDPNDKKEAHGGYFTPIQVASKENLLYTIRFQNTGTDTAFNIKVTDTLDTKLDWATLEMVSASHPYKLDIVNGDKCTWFFSHILLPDSTRNEPASHGYISYRIKPKSTVVLGDTIKNSASIFFDFNTAIITNVEKTIIGSQVPSTLLPVPLPIVNGLSASYCSNVAIQKGKVMNIPNSSYAATYQVKLDNTTILNLAPDSTFSFNVNTLALGQHTLDVSYTNALGTKTKTFTFIVNTTFTPDVILSTNPTNTLGNIVLTATNQTGGGNNPLYTYATDRNFTTIIQPEGIINTSSLVANSLPVGINWFYVKMKTSEQCFTKSADVDSAMIPIVDIPQTSIIKNEYCSIEGTQSNNISNIPTTNYASTTTVKLDNVIIAINNGQFNFNPATLALGAHTLTITFSNAYITKTITKNFTIKETINPAVQVSTNKASITQNEIAVLTATPLNAGANPLYLFALDNMFTNVLQAESTNNSLTLNANTLAPSLYTIYTRIKTTQSCYSKLYHVDSVSVKRNGSLSILDRNNVITITPNPFASNININGLDINKAYSIELVDNNGRVVYKQKVNNQFSHKININLPKTVYLLRINNITDNSKLKSIKLIKA